MTVVAGLLLVQLAGAQLAQDPADAGTPSPPAADQVTVVVEPEPSLIGDLLQISVRAAHPAGTRVNLPLGLSLAGLEVVQARPVETRAEGDGLLTEFALTVQRFDVRDAVVPGFTLTLVQPDATVKTLPVPPTPFTVTRQLVNESDPKRRGEGDPVSLPYPSPWGPLQLTLGALFLVLGALATYLWLSWWRRPKLVIVPPSRPAHELALASLAALEVERAALLARGQVQDYYLSLTDILRNYLEGRFGVAAVEQTTTEIRELLLRDQGRLLPLDAGEVIRFLLDCDLVKFARQDPGEARAAEALDELRAMVERSVPVAPPPGATAATDAPTDTPNDHVPPPPAKGSVPAPGEFAA